MSTSIKKISILGCGWLGLPLGAQLALSGYDIHGSTTSPEKLPVLKAQGIHPYLIRVNEQLESDNPAFFQTDLLILNIPPGRRRPDVVERYPAEIKTVMEQALLGGTRRLLFISSTSVYANTNDVVFETEPLKADKGSGLALLQCEKYLRGIPHLPVTILRLAGLVGGDRKAGRFLAGKKDVRNGDAPVNLVHRDDCVAIIRQLIAQDRFGDTFNICADEHPSRKDFYQQQARKEGYEAPSFLPEKTSQFKIISNQKIKNALNYSFLHPDPMAF